MKQRFLSIFTVVALMASVIAGAMGVSLRYAKADTIDSVSAITFSDFWDMVLDDTNVTSRFSSSDLETFFNYVNPKIADIEENEYYFCFACHDIGTSKWAVTLYQSDVNYMWSYNINNFNNGIGYHSISNVKFHEIAKFTFDGNGGTLNQNYVGSNSRYVTRTSAFSYGSAAFFPTTHDFNVSGRLIYSSRSVTDGNFNDLPSWSCSQNLFYYIAPSYDEINLVSFNVGIKRFLTVDDQDYVQGMDPEKDEYSWAILGLDKEGNDFDIVLNDSDLVIVPNADFYTDELFNLATYGALCWELPNDLDVIASSGFGVRNILGQIDSLVAVCINCPYWINEELLTEEQLQDQQYMQAFNTFNTYVESYNTTHVIPENLADTLYGLNGSKLYPCSVSVPKSVWNSNSTGASNQLSDQHNWKWWFASRSDLGMNFELMDVVIISESATGQYSLLYYYSDTLNNPFQYVKNFSFQDLFENFDIVIIVPDDLNCLDGNTWWKDLLETICQNLGIQNLSNDLLSSLGISGSDSLGVEYVDSQPLDVAGVLQGFCIVTKKAIQRQQLFVFNDGLTKTYKLMSDYIENRGKWEDSFLLWTASLFSQWQSLDGKLGDIYNLLYGWNLSSVLSDISESLARIANNTSEEDPGYWFLSLFNWLNRFSVTDSDFANWVSEYDDFTDDLPDPGTGATVIPFPTAIPTVAVGG